VGHDNDYLNVDPGYSANIQQNTGMTYADSTNASQRPFIDFTLGTAGAAEVAKVDGVAEQNILKVIGVANANIAKINGVDMP